MMITNERQYRISQTQAEKFSQAIEAAEEAKAPVGVHPRIHQAMVDGLRSQHDELARDLRAYEALREGKVRKRTITSLLDLPTVLIEGRIAKRMTQKRLAEQLDLPEQQIQRYEASRYAGVNLERLQQIATAIGLRLRETIDFDLPTPTLATGGPTRGTSSRRTSKRRSSTRRTKTRPTAKRATTATASAKRSPATTKRSTAKKTKSSKPAAKKTAAKQTATKKTTAKRTAAKSRSKTARRR